MKGTHQHEYDYDERNNGNEDCIFLPEFRSQDGSVVKVYVIRTELSIMASVAVIIRATSPAPFMFANGTGHVSTSFVLFDF